MDNNLHDFEQFMKQRQDAARAYVSGDAAPIARIVTRVSPATFFGPDGGYEQGADHVFSTYQRGAEQFGSGGDSQVEILQIWAGDGIAYYVGLQRATVRMRARTQEIPLDLRVTEVFRREGDEWKLVHRHADSLVSDQSA